MSRVTDHTRTEKIGGDSILIFVVIQVERETVMTFDFKVAGEGRLLQLNELDEFRLEAYENAKLYKERTKNGMISNESSVSLKLVKKCYYTTHD